MIKHIFFLYGTAALAQYIGKLVFSKNSEGPGGHAGEVKKHASAGIQGVKFWQNYPFKPLSLELKYFTKS